MRTYLRSSERGSILIQTAIVMLGLLAFCALTIDYGIMWVARGQAQNAADAGARAGAFELAFGDAADTEHVKVKDAGIAAAQANKVFGEMPVIEPEDVTVGPCPEDSPGLPDTCVRVEVFRNSERGNPLPRFFLKLVGDGNAEHGVRATATAQVATGAKTTCLKPWVVPDKWRDLRDTTAPVDTNNWTLDDTFDKYDRTGNPKNWQLLGPPGTVDEYDPPSADDPGTGYTVPDDVGKRVRLKAGRWQDSPLGPGNMQALELPGPCGGGESGVTCNIETCNPTPVGVGDVVSTKPGNFGQPQVKALDNWLAGDTAVWECADGTSPLDKDCVGAPSNPGSKRLVAIAAINIQEFLDNAKLGLQDPNGKFDIKISRLLGFFIESYNNDEIIGRFAYYPSSSPGKLGGNLEDSANFLRQVILVR